MKCNYFQLTSVLLFSHIFAGISLGSPHRIIRSAGELVNSSKESEFNAKERVIINTKLICSFGEVTRVSEWRYQNYQVFKRTHCHNCVGYPYVLNILQYTANLECEY